MTIFKDSKGYMWFGTRDGLNRYDGTQFEIFRYNELNPNSISNNSITAIEEDKNGILWIGTTNGLNSYDSNTNKFTKYKNGLSKNLSISNNHITSIISDKNGAIWVGTYDGLNVLYNGTNSFKTYYNTINNSYNPKNRNSYQNFHNIWIKENNYKKYDALYYPYFEIKQDYYLSGLC